MSFASPFPQVQIPTTSVYDYLFGDLSDDDADRIALVDAKSGAETTYRDMLDAHRCLRRVRLAQRGIGVGDVVGLLAPNSSAFAIAFHGILRAGATATTINALFTAKDIAKQLTDSHAKASGHGEAAARPGRSRRPPSSGCPMPRSSCSTVPALPPTATPTPTTCSGPRIPHRT